MTTALLALLLQLIHPRPSGHPNDHPMCLPRECSFTLAAPRVMVGVPVKVCWAFPGADGLDPDAKGCSVVAKDGTVEITEPTWLASGRQWHLVGAMMPFTVWWQREDGSVFGGKDGVTGWCVINLDPNLPNGGIHDLTVEGVHP